MQTLEKMSFDCLRSMVLFVSIIVKPASVNHVAFVFLFLLPLMPCNTWYAALIDIFLIIRCVLSHPTVVFVPWIPSWSLRGVVCIQLDITERLHGNCLSGMQRWRDKTRVCGFGHRSVWSPRKWEIKGFTLLLPRRRNRTELWRRIVLISCT